MFRTDQGQEQETLFSEFTFSVEECIEAIVSQYANTTREEKMRWARLHAYLNCDPRESYFRRDKIDEVGVAVKLHNEYAHADDTHPTIPEGVLYRARRRFSARSQE